MTRFTMKSHTTIRRAPFNGRHSALPATGIFPQLEHKNGNGEAGAQRRELNIAVSSSLHKRLSSFARDESPSVKFNVQNIYKPLDALSTLHYENDQLQMRRLA